MDFEQFKNKMAYPNYDKIKMEVELTTLNEINTGNLKGMTSIKEIEAYIKNAATDIYHNKIQVYRDEDSRLFNEFKKQALIESGFDEFPQKIQDIAFDQAVSETSGYNDIFCHLCNLYDYTSRISGFFIK